MRRQDFKLGSFKEFAMVQTASTMLPLGTSAPAFALPDTISGQTLSLEQLKSDKATVVMFICNHCPYVKHVQHELVRLARDYQPKGVAFIAISSNDAESYPEDAPDKMKEVAQRLGYPFPYLYDETQEVARAYQAACTRPAGRIHAGQQQTGDRTRPARGARGAARGPTRTGRSKAQPGLQHQIPEMSVSRGSRCRRLRR
jgi:peroxiredoxin